MRYNSNRVLTKFQTTMNIQGHAALVEAIYGGRLSETFFTEAKSYIMENAVRVDHGAVDNNGDPSFCLVPRIDETSGRPPVRITWQKREKIWRYQQLLGGVYVALPLYSVVLLAERLERTITANSGALPSPEEWIWDTGAAEVSHLCHQRKNGCFAPGHLHLESPPC